MAKQNVFYDGYGFAHFEAPKSEIGEHRVTGPAQASSSHSASQKIEDVECLVYNKEGEHKKIREVDTSDFNKLGWFSSKAEAVLAFNSLKDKEKSLEKKKKELSDADKKAA